MYIMVKTTDRKIWKVNEAYVMTIPKQYVDNGLIDPNKLYDAELSESKKEVLSNEEVKDRDSKQE